MTGCRKNTGSTVRIMDMARDIPGKLNLQIISCGEVVIEIHLVPVLVNK